MDNSSAIVMVDDNRHEVTLAVECYKLAGLSNPWLSFSSGTDFLSYLREVKESTKPMPGIVLLDINMPEMNGFDVLRATKSDSYFRELPPFLMFTNSRDPSNVEKAESLGACGVKVKPNGIDAYVEFFESLSEDDCDCAARLN